MRVEFNVNVAMDMEPEEIKSLATAEVEVTRIREEMRRDRDAFDKEFDAHNAEMRASKERAEKQYNEACRKLEIFEEKYETKAKAWRKEFEEQCKAMHKEFEEQCKAINNETL